MKTNYRLLVVLLVAAMFGALVLLARPALADDKDKIVGVWKLVSVVYEDAKTKERTPVLGEHRGAAPDCNPGGALACTGDR